MTGRGHVRLADRAGTEFLEHQIDASDKLIIAADQVQLRPIQLESGKPD
jgi:hypothetical protein